tara:strand:+ start:158 stop:880 length:723 start_codon:yes stop_codon:yes gene_type:complete
MDYKKASDQNVFQAREKIKKNFGQNIYELIDQYPLFACPQTMLRVNKNFELLKRSLKIPGDIFEFGTWRGATAIFFAKILDEIEPQSNRKIFVFDNFSGLPEPTDLDSEYAKTQIGKYKGDKKSMEYIIDAFELNHRLELIEGDALTTIPSFFEDNKPYLVSMAYFDFDLYEPTKIAWNFIKKYILEGSILVFDEGLDRDRWSGEFKVIEEIMNDPEFKNKLLIEPNKLSRQPEVIIEII